MWGNMIRNKRVFLWCLEFFKKITLYHLTIITVIYSLYTFFAEIAWTQPDPRTVDWFLVRSPIPVLIIVFSYIYFVQHLGPKLMKKHSPFNLSTILMVYNVAQIVHNVWILSEVLQAGWWGSYNLLCQPLDFSSSPQALRMANVCWHYYINKMIDLFDTIFFVLRKKNNQITPLHVLHHSGMPAVGFICVRYYPGGHGTLTGLLNSFVHSIMYFYYFIAGLGPRFKKYLWWKQYLTLLQMTQFLLISIHCSFIFLFDCDFAKRTMLYLMINTIFMFILFSSFYRQTYMKKTS